MKKVVIERLETSDQGTFGRLILPEMTLFTGELPWRDNINDHSCIPAGIYLCAWTMSARFHRKMYLVQSVPNRTGIRKHSANFMGDDSLGFKRQLNGCIALGEKIGWMDGQKALLVSAPAVRRFETLMAGNIFQLEIKECLK